MTVKFLYPISRCICQQTLLKFNRIYVKFYSENVKTEVRPRFAFALSEKVKEDFLQEKFKAKNHPGLIKQNCKETKLPVNVEVAIKTIKEEDGYSQASLLNDGTKLTRYIWERQTPYEDHELRETLEEVTAKLLRKGRLQNLYNSEGPKSMEDLTETEQNILSKNLKKHVYNWSPLEMNDYMSFVYLWARAAPEYASLITILHEVKMRVPDFQPKTLFDFGSGVGTVTWAVNHIWPDICQEVYNVDASLTMNNLAERIQRLCVPDSNISSQVKKTYYRQFLPTSETLRFDLVVSSRSFFEVGRLKERARTVDILWRKVNPGGFLVLVETGTRHGYTLLMELRDYLLNICKVEREKYSIDSPIHVFAPCTHDLNCPRFNTPNRDPCHFAISYEQAKELTRAQKAKQELFFFVVLRKAMRDDDVQWPRIVEPVLKKHAHTIVRTCSPEGKLREFVVTKAKHGKTCYRICRKCKLGDFLPIQPSATIDETLSQHDTETSHSDDPHQ